MKPEIEDGMGFSGLVPTREEREQDRRHQAERKRFKDIELQLADAQLARNRYMDICEKLSKDRARLVSLLTELIDIEGPQPGTATWYDKVQTTLSEMQ
jgi:translation initiation factor 2 beta subunit (eIF-2beta)/eIF-5